MTVEDKGEGDRGANVGHDAGADGGVRIEGERGGGRRCPR